MEEDLHKIWRCLRPTVKDGCTFAMIKDLVATSGLPVKKLSHLQQRSIHERGGASKGELLDAVGDLIEKANEPTEAIRKLIAALLEMNPDLGDKVLECTQRFGWTVLDGQLRPSDLTAFRQAWKRFEEAIPGSVRLVPQPDLRTVIERDYGAMQGMILGDVPDFGWVMEQLQYAEAAINGT